MRSLQFITEVLTFFSRAEFKRLSFLKMAKIGSVILQIQESKRVLEQDTLRQNLLSRNIDYSR